MQRFLLLMGLIWASMVVQHVAVFGQLNEPKRLRIGASLGAGGLHTYVGPSVDVHYHTTCLRVSPGFLFYGVGITQKAGFWRKSNGIDKIPIIFSFYYLDDYLFTTVKRNLNPSVPQRKDLDLYLIMAGAHFPLDRRDRVFGEAQIGMMIVREHFFDFYDIPVPSKTYFYPMVEVRIGGILQLHQYRKQKMR
jgi:hypothetical protein